MGGDVDRREFLRRGALVGAGVALAPLAASGEPTSTEPGVRRLASLGRTGLEMADVSFGSSRLSGDEDLVRHALDRGVNYFDTAESYRGGASETTIGRALRGKRDRVVIASKVKCDVGSTRAELMRALEGSLRRLQTDHVDIYFNHAVNDVERLKNPEWPAFVEQAKKQGKLRFTGMSGHGGRLVPCLDHALDNDLFDVILVGYNFGQDPAFYERFTRRFDFVAVQPDLPRVLRRAREKGVGVIAMKTLMGARLNDLRRYESPGSTFAQAALRWTLSNPDVDGLIVSMTSPEQVDEYLGASGWQQARWNDPGLLSRYVTRQTASYCRHGCDACIDACPEGVPIAEVLRTGMYDRDYGDRRLARDDYAALDRDAAACVDCPHQACMGACPHGIPIEQVTGPIHQRLTSGSRQS